MGIVLAHRVGVSPSTIYLWESGKFDPRVSQFRKLADVLGVTMDSIDLEQGEQEEGDA